MDTGTRVGRFFLQEMVGRLIPRFLEKRWLPGIVLTSLAFTSSWGYLVYTGDIATIWPLFGMSNQLLAACGLIVGTIMLSKYTPVAHAPGALRLSWQYYVKNIPNLDARIDGAGEYI